MAAIVNAADVMLQATDPRLLQTTLADNISVPSTNITGLPAPYSPTQCVTLNTNSLVFKQPTIGATVPSTIILTASLNNITGTPVFTVTNGSCPVHVAGNVATVFPDEMVTTTATIQVSVAANSKTYTDQLTIAKLVDGTTTVVALLSHESFTVSSDPLGNVTPTDLANAKGTYYVFQGVTDKTGSSVTYSVQAQSGMSVQLNTDGTFNVTDVMANIGTATLRAAYAGVVVDKVLTVTKSPVDTRGTAYLTVAVTGNTWTDAAATTALYNAGLGDPHEMDIVVEYNKTNGFSATKYFDGSAWQSLDAYINGNMLVSGTITADKLNVSNLSAVSANLGTVTSGSIKSSNIMGGAYTSFAWPAAGPSNNGFYLGPEGLLLGNANNGSYFEVTAAGAIYAPGFSVVNGNATFTGTLAANTVTTSNLVTGAVSNWQSFSWWVPPNTGQNGTQLNANMVFSVPAGSFLLVVVSGHFTPFDNGGGQFYWGACSVNASSYWAGAYAYAQDNTAYWNGSSYSGWGCMAYIMFYSASGGTLSIPVTAYTYGNNDYLYGQVITIKR